MGNNVVDHAFVKFQESVARCHVITELAFSIRTTIKNEPLLRFPLVEEPEHTRQRARVEKIRANADTLVTKATFESASDSSTVTGWSVWVNLMNWLGCFTQH